MLHTVRQNSDVRKTKKKLNICTLLAFSCWLLASANIRLAISF